MSGYPTIVRRSETRWESEEQQDGTPDFIIERVERGAHGIRVKSRTSAMLYRFDTVGDAKIYISSSFGERG